MGLNNVFVLLVIRFLLLTLAVGHRLTVLRKFHHSSPLFKVTMIDWLLSGIKWGWERKRAYVLTVGFLGTRLGY